ncbi:hypothetical protein [Methylorubrum salsuginis]|uniref:hypothetical protein n=1 Tax=Methylorubrum salsuginis TaxID=414703 RepID=UPI000B87040D|nr:hypothetical protein [Methylorubrum salsuginis]
MPPILSALRERAVTECRDRWVVAVPSTTAPGFGGTADRHGLGPGGDERHPGFFMHPVVAVDAQDEAVPSLLDAQPTLAFRHAGSRGGAVGRPGSCSGSVCCWRW